MKVKKCLVADLAGSYIKNLKKKMLLMTMKDIHRLTNNIWFSIKVEIASQVHNSSLILKIPPIQESVTALLMMSFNFRSSIIWIRITKCSNNHRKYNINTYNKICNKMQNYKFRVKSTQRCLSCTMLTNLIIKMIHRLKKDSMWTLVVIDHNLLHLYRIMRNKNNNPL